MTELAYTIDGRIANDDDENDILLILSTGGVKGLWQASLLDELLDSEIFTTHNVSIIGGSAGAINAMLLNKILETGRRIRLANFWAHLIIPRFRSSVYRKKRFINIVWNILTGSDGLIDPEELYTSLVKEITLYPTDDRLQQMRSRSHRIYVCSYDLAAERIITVANDDPRFDIIAVASAAIPILIKTVKMEGAILTDIGVVDPLLYHTVYKTDFIRNLKNKKVVAILAQRIEDHGSVTYRKNNIEGVANKCINAMMNSLIHHQFELLHDKVVTAVSFDDWFTHDFFSDPLAMSYMIRRGKEDAREVLKTIREL